MSKVIMVRRVLDEVLRLGARLEPWGTITHIENPVCDDIKFFGVVVLTDDGMTVTLYYRTDEIHEVMFVGEEVDTERACNLASFVVSETLRSSKVNSTDALLKDIGLMDL